MARRSLALLAAVPLFHTDIQPLLERHCQSCHRPGEAAPMALLTYEQVRPYARAIREKVLRGAMPPWFAEAPRGHFANDPRLSPAEMDTIRRWADAGAPPGPFRPPSAQWTEGWRIDTPDAVLSPPRPIAVPATGEIDYQHIIVPTGFDRDRWVSQIEIRPSSRAQVHHAVLFVRPPRSRWLRSQAPGVPFSARGAALEGLSTLDEAVATYLPGSAPLRLPSGQAKLIPAGSDLIFQIHYATNGTAAQDLPRAGLVFAREQPRYRHYTVSVADGRFQIPPYAPAHAVEARFRVQTPAAIVSLAPHMHIRGKAMEVRLESPGGSVQRLLSVPRYDFVWQLVYLPARPVAVERGSELVVTAVFDNSRNNPRNPDPSATVTWGEQSREEMALCFIGFLLPGAISPNELFRPPRLLPPGPGKD